MLLQSRRDWRARHFTLALLLPLLVTTNPESTATAKGPQKPDFIIETAFHVDGVYNVFMSTGVIETSGTYCRCGGCVFDEWEGQMWCRYSFPDYPTENGYFEVWLLTEGGNQQESRSIPFQLTAGPEGFFHNGVLYEGVFATGTARRHDRWMWDVYGNGERFRHYYQEFTLECYLVP